MAENDSGHVDFEALVADVEALKDGSQARRLAAWSQGPAAPPPPAPGSLGYASAERQAQLRRLQDAADAQWEREVEVDHEIARLDQQERYAANAPQREKAQAAIAVDEVELEELDQQRDELRAALAAVECQRGPVLERMAANREEVERFTEATMPIPPPRRPKPSTVHVSPLAGHGGYLHPTRGWQA